MSKAVMTKLPNIDGQEIRALIQRYGINVTLRKRDLSASGLQPCTCISQDDVFHQIDPECTLCGGTGAINGTAFRDSTIRMVIQPQRPQGFQGVSNMYSYTGTMERAHEVGYVWHDVDIDIGDWILSDTTRPDGDEVTIEFEVYNKDPYYLGIGPSRPKILIYKKIELRRTEYPKTITEVDRY